MRAILIVLSTTLFGLAEVSAAAAPVIGERAPPLEVTTVEGRAVALAPGKVTLVDFSTPGCAPCHDAQAALEAIVGELSAEVDLVIVEAEAPVEAVRRGLASRPAGAGVAVAVDPEGAATRRWGSRRFPTVFVVDGGGVIRFINRGYGPGFQRRLAERARRLLH
jgi:thiol-disulfide isomerase/thioredoxin